MNTIFLDVDGVINRNETYNKTNIDPELVANLATLVYQTNAQIVLSSSWRHYFIKEKNQFIDGKLKQTGKPGLATELVTALSKQGLTITDMLDTERSNDSRGTLIRKYVTQHGITNFVILDDDEFDFVQKGLKPYHVKTFFGIYNWVPVEAQGFNKTKLIEAYCVLKKLTA